MKLSQYIVFFYLILCPQLVYYSLGEKSYRYCRHT